MADQIITGQVFLTHRFSSSEAKIFGEYLKERALKNKIWPNLCGHFSSPDVQYKYPPDDYLQKGYIPFEITDSENSSEANRILSDILYDENYCFDRSGSRLSVSGRFFRKMCDSCE